MITYFCYMLSQCPSHGWTILIYFALFREYILENNCFNSLSSVEIFTLIFYLVPIIVIS